MEKRDLIIGGFSNYDWDKIKYWANSIDISGFRGAHNLPDIKIIEIKEGKITILEEKKLANLIN